MKTITCLNQKGGTGKTSTVLCLAQGLALKGNKVLVIDLDSQGNTTFSLGGEHTNGQNALTLLMGVPPQTCVQNVDTNIDLIPSTIELKDASALLGNVGGEFKLRNALDMLKGSYDYCLVDNPPTLNQITINTLTACDSVIIPCLADIFSLQGLMQLTQTIKEVKKSYNPSLVIEGILLTQYNSRATLTAEMTDILNDTAEKIGTKVFNTRIRVNQKVKDAQALQQNLYKYAPGCHATEDYTALIKELIGE